MSSASASSRVLIHVLRSLSLLALLLSLLFFSNRRAKCRQHGAGTIITQPCCAMCYFRTDQSVRLCFSCSWSPGRRRRLRRRGRRWGRDRSRVRMKKYLNMSWTTLNWMNVDITVPVFFKKQMIWSWYVFYSLLWINDLTLWESLIIALCLM